MKTKTILNSISAVLLTSFAAHAADLQRPGYKAPEYIAPAPFSWTGFYVGANAGYLWGNSKWSGSAGNFEVAPAGFMAGGTLGYNYQTGSWVWGIEGDIDYVNAKGTANSAICASCTFKDTWLGTVRGRVGYSFGQWLPYLTGGGAFGNVYVSSAAGSKTQTRDGWTVGTGVEYAFAGAWSAKLEYLYVDLGSFSCGSAGCPVPPDERVNFTSNIIRAGVNYRF